MNILENINKKLLSKKLNEYQIDNYVINEDLTVDVNGNVNFSNKNLIDIPIKFNIVNGIFDCSKNHITNLKNSPNKVYKFICSNNELSNLENGPVEVLYEYDCSCNKITSLSNMPTNTIDIVRCDYNKLVNLRGISPINKKIIANNNGLFSVEGLNKNFIGDVIVHSNNLNDFRSFPNEMIYLNINDNNFSNLYKCPKVKSLFCANNKITSIKGVPNIIDNLDCSQNLLTNLDDMPQLIKESFNCSYNLLENLKNTPLVKQHYNCSHNKLTTLKGLTTSKLNYLNCSFNNLTSFKYLPPFINILFIQNNNIKDFEYFMTETIQFRTDLKYNLDELSTIIAENIYKNKK